MTALKFPSVLTQYFPFNGGLDQVTPPIQMFEGGLRYGVNVEIGVRGGYTTCFGYERYSGQTRPSSATYARLGVTLSATVNVGDVVTNAAVTAFGTVIAIESATVLVLTKITGVFTAAQLKVGAAVVGSSTGAQATGSAATAALDASYTALAANVYRALVTQVPGSGGILGVHQYGGHVYAFRNNALATATVMHVESSVGWTAVALGREMAFTSGGTYEIAEGNVITGATSGATATVKRIAMTSGTWAAGTAAGTLIFASQTGNFSAAENLNVGATLNVATVTANSTAITLLPNGRYDFKNWNFGGQLGTLRMYGCDGVNKGFEFDGTVYVPIHTGMNVDAPAYMEIHKNALFFAFASSVQFSGPGSPYQFSPIFGAAEIACGDDVTDLQSLPGSATVGAMTIKTKNGTFVLYGNDDTDFNLVPYNYEVGCEPFTMQVMNSAMSGAISFDTQGLSTLVATQNFGNFVNGIISDKILPFMNGKVGLATASCIVRKKNQYRLFFSDGDAVFVTYSGDKIQGMTTMTFPHDVTCISSQEGSSGREEIYFGSSDGYVRQAEIGTSFDGQAINWLAYLTYNHFKGPRQLKTFRKAAMEVSGSGYAAFNMTSSLGYGSSEFVQASSQSLSASLTSSFWDSFQFDAFVWDGSSLSPAEGDLYGTAENISLLFSGASDAYQPITLNSTIIHYTQRRLLR